MPRSKRAKKPQARRSRAKRKSIAALARVYPYRPQGGLMMARAAGPASAAAVACPLDKVEVERLVVSVIQSFHPELEIVPSTRFADVQIDGPMKRNYGPEIRDHMQIKGCDLKAAFSGSALEACKTVAEVVTLAFNNRK